MRSTPSPAITAFCPSLLSSLWARCCTSAFCPKQSTPSSKFDKIFDSHYNIGVYSVQVHLGNIPLFKVYLKTKKMTDISQTQTGFKAKSRGNPLWIPRLLTQNPAAFVEIDDIFDFSAAPSIVFSIAHTTIHSKCGVEQFVCPQSVLSVGAARPGQPWHATNIQVHCESPDLFQWQVFFQPLSDQGQVRHQHGHSTNVRTIITIARRDCVGAY